MKKAKKILLTVGAYILTAALAIGGTVAYLHSEDSDVNIMTLGNVKIEQLEYERVVDENGNWISTGKTDKYGYTPDELREFKQDKPLYPAVFADGKIKWDDRNGSQDAAGTTSHQQSWAQVGASGSNQLFDDSVKNVQDKFVFVENTGKSGAYVRTLFAFEQGKIAADNFKNIIMTNTNKDHWSWETVATDVEIKGNTYFVMSATYIGPKSNPTGILAPDTVSYPSLLQVYMKPEATNDDVKAIDGNGNGTYEILVVSQAIQAEGFSDAHTALASFGEPDEVNAESGIMLCADWFGDAIADYEAEIEASKWDTWDGTADTSWYNDTDKEFTLATAEELAGFANLANNGTSFSGKTILLDYNIDLDGKQWTPINKFNGKLDGNGHRISNFHIDATANHGGFFNVLEWATVEGLTLTDVTATVGDYRFGALARNINQTNIDNVTVKNVNVTTTTPKAFVAGLFSHGTVNSNMEVNNCTVEDLTVNAENGADMIGGITTFVQKNGTEAEGTNIFENLNVKNFKVIVNDDDGVCGVGGLVGQTQSVWQNPRFNNCTVAGLVVNATGSVDVGGFICYPGSVTFAENCTTEGKIDVTGVTSVNDYAGGFFANYGWGDNIGKGDHKVTSCSADVDITTKYASAGGFVGSGTNSEGKNKNITLTNCEAKGTVTCVEGGTAIIGAFAGQTDRGIYTNCSAAQNPFIGKVLDGYTIIDDGNGTLTVTK